MTDIVERLRSHMGKQDVAILIADCREAADEIERERKAHMELAASYHDATEEIDRLRCELEDDCLYKKECERLKGALEIQKQASRDVAATYNEQEAEIERLEHMQANLHGHIKRLEDENTKLRERLRFDDEEPYAQIDSLRAENAKLKARLKELGDG
jgi:cell division protein FtsB